MESPGLGSSSVHAQGLFYPSRDCIPYTSKIAPFQPSVTGSLPSAKSCRAPFGPS